MIPPPSLAYGDAPDMSVAVPAPLPSPPMSTPPESPPAFPLPSPVAPQPLVRMRDGDFAIGGLVHTRKQQFERGALSPSGVAPPTLFALPSYDDPPPAPLTLADLGSPPHRISSPIEAHRSVSQSSGVLPAPPPSSRPPRRLSVTSLATAAADAHLATFTEALSKIQRRFRHSGAMASTYETVTFGVAAFHGKGGSKLGGLSNQRAQLLAGLPGHVMTSAVVDEWLRAVCADVVPGVDGEPPVDAVPRPLTDTVGDPFPVGPDGMRLFEHSVNMLYREDVVMAQVCVCVCTHVCVRVYT